jgi:Uma2 family endonuclease
MGTSLLDGELLERNAGELPHGILQLEFGGFFRDLRKQGRPVRAAVETRIRVAPRKYRIPDVCVCKEPSPRDRVPSTPPFIAIEIPSPEDRMRRVRKKIDQYLAFGISYVWLIDPERRRADVYTASGFQALDD